MTEIKKIITKFENLQQKYDSDFHKECQRIIVPEIKKICRRVKKYYPNTKFLRQGMGVAGFDNNNIEDMSLKIKDLDLLIGLLRQTQMLKFLSLCLEEDIDFADL